jgi:pilus assembly protein CpaF
MSAQDIIETEVRDIVRRQSLDPLSEREAVRRIVDDVVNRYGERSLAFTMPALADPPETSHEVFNAVAGYGAIQKYLDDPSVEEIWINEPSRVFVARNGRSELTTTVLTADEVRDLVERMLKSTGRRIDFSTPFVDAMLLDGSRLHVAIPDITRVNWAVNIRSSWCGPATWRTWSASGP